MAAPPQAPASHRRLAATSFACLGGRPPNGLSKWFRAAGRGAALRKRPRWCDRGCAQTSCFTDAHRVHRAATSLLLQQVTNTTLDPGRGGGRRAGAPAWAWRIPRAGGGGSRGGRRRDRGARGEEQVVGRARSRSVPTPPPTPHPPTHPPTRTPPPLRPTRHATQAAVGALWALQRPPPPPPPRKLLLLLLLLPARGGLGIPDHLRAGSTATPPTPPRPPPFSALSYSHRVIDARHASWGVSRGLWGARSRARGVHPRSIWAPLRGDATAARARPSLACS